MLYQMKKLYLQLRSIYLSIVDWLARKNGIQVMFNGSKINLPGRYYRYFTNDYEKDNFIFLNQRIKPGSTCIDVGAHIGLYTVYMASLSKGNVFSFEPTPESFTILKKVVAINHCENSVTLLPLAVDQKTGKGFFYLNSSTISGTDATRIAEANSLIYVDFGKSSFKEKIEVDTVSIDDFTEKNKLEINFIKIDAEGAELNVLRGAGRTILKDRPCGIISVHVFSYRDKQQTLSDIWQIINDYKLTPFYGREEIIRSQFMKLAETDIFDFQFTPRSC